MKDMEEILLSKNSLDDLIKMKIEEEFKTNEKKLKQKSVKKIITDLKDVPQNQIFTKNSVFKLFNRKNKTETFIDGIQADSFIGAQTGIREKFFDGTLTTFATEDAYVRFEKAVICADL